MTDKKDKTPAGIDTSHLSIEETSGSLEKKPEVEAPSINTSHLSLEDSNTVPPLDKTVSATDTSGSETPPVAPELPGLKPSEEINKNITKPGVKAKTSAPDTKQEKLAKTPSPPPSENLLFVKNPLASKPAPATSSTGDSTTTKANNIDQTNSEEVVITSHVTDQDFDKEMQSGKADASEESSQKEADDDDSESPMKSLLDTVKKPESLVQNAWTNSSARRYLIDNVESYRVKDEDKNMENVIEKVYGGTVEKKISPIKFLRENVLFSFLLFIFIFLVGWKAAGIIFPNLMPELNDQIIKTVKQTAAPKKVIKEKKIVETNHSNKEKIDKRLHHCLVEPNARIAFTRAFTPIGYQFSNKTITLSYEEMNSSIRVWEGMNMDFYISDAIFRFRELSRLALPIIQQASKAVSDYRSSLVVAKEELVDLDNRIRSIQTKLGNQSIYTVNKRIPLLAQRDNLNARIEQEPKLKRFDQLLKKISLAETILKGRIKPKRMEPDEITLEDPDWLLSTAETTASDISAPIIGKALPAIQIPADKLKKVFPKLTAFHLIELDKALDDLIKLSSLIIYLPENQLLSYKLDLLALNRNLNRTMKKDLKAWLAYSRCLAQGRAQIPAEQN